MRKDFSKLYLLPVSLIFLLFIIIVEGCSTDECYDNRNALPYAGFYGYMDGKMGSVSVDSMEVYGVNVPGDSILWEGKRSLSSLYLPFRIDSDTTTYVFHPISRILSMLGLTDTVTFIYDREARFVSSACGASYLYKIKEIRHSGILIDSVVCPGMEITNANRENIQIYFYTGEETDPTIP
ncbi:MAG: hypothetical protein HDS62_06895 [Bacteroidales bacterium]|nr:hypothetical protein [Bacteroidales bacterium]